MTERHTSTYFLLALTLTVLLGGVSARQDIRYFGAIPNIVTSDAAAANAKALQQAFDAAIAATDAADREVYVPAGELFMVFPVQVSDFADITFRIDGVLRAPDNITAWPQEPVGHFLTMFHFTNTTRFTLTGNGEVDGEKACGCCAFWMSFISYAFVRSLFEYWDHIISF